MGATGTGSKDQSKMATEDNWKWDGLEINGYSTFNRLLRRDCTKANLMVAMNEAPEIADPPSPTANMFTVQPGKFYKAKQKHANILLKRSRNFEQIISIILSRLDAVLAQRIKYIADNRVQPAKIRIALILQNLSDLEGDNIVNTKRRLTERVGLPNGNDATKPENQAERDSQLGESLRLSNAAHYNKKQLGPRENDRSRDETRGREDYDGRCRLDAYRGRDRQNRPDNCTRQTDDRDRSRDYRSDISESDPRKLDHREEPRRSGVYDRIDKKTAQECYKRRIEGRRMREEAIDARAQGVERTSKGLRRG